MSRERNYTKGPWEANAESLRVEKGHTTLACVTISLKVSANGAEANANLISAAPELLEALENADEVICQLCKRLNPQHEECSSCEDRESLVSAIKKAYGETE